MNENLLSKSWKYWIYGFLGFVFIYLFTLTFPKLSMISKIDDLDEVRTRIIYLFCEGIFSGLIAFLLSFPVLIYFEKKWNWGKIDNKVLIVLILIIFVTQFLFSLLIWPILALLMDIIYGNQDLLRSHTLLSKIVNVPYFTMRFLGWFWVVFVYYGYYYLKTTLLRQLELETTLNRSRLNTLKGQINPHFMFNSLNNIRGLMLEDVRKSRTMLTKLSEMLRFSLNMDEVNFILLRKELEMVDNYISLSKIQFEERLQYSCNVEEVDLDFLVPPMIIQLLVENAVKHGISNLKKGGIVQVQFENEKNFLIISVKNSGKLRKESDSTKLGIANIRKRLALLYNGKANFSLLEKNDEVIATIKLPQS